MEVRKQARLAGVLYVLMGIPGAFFLQYVDTLAQHVSKQAGPDFLKGLLLILAMLALAAARPLVRRLRDSRSARAEPSS